MRNLFSDAAQLGVKLLPALKVCDKLFLSITIQAYVIILAVLT
jgi:hypothetical protein